MTSLGDSAHILVSTLSTKMLLLHLRLSQSFWTMWLSNTSLAIFAADMLTNGGKDIALGDFTEIWKAQRKIAFSAIR